MSSMPEISPPLSSCPAPAPSPRIAVVVLNWNGKDDTLQCLQSLAQLAYGNCEVIVVDNGSADGSVAAIRAAFPAIRVIETGANLGYAEGNNVGMRAALESGAEFVLLLNNDTIVDPSLLCELLAAAEACPEAGVFGAKIFHYDERDRIWYAGARWNAELLRFELVTDEAIYGEPFAQVLETDYACGCALFVRRAVLEQIGLLDPQFFLTYEETDFCYRARRSGFRVVYAPRAVLWHKISASFGGQQAPLVSYFMTRNYLLWSELNLPPEQKRAARRYALWDLRRRLTPQFPFKAEWSTLRPSVFAASAKRFYWNVHGRWSDPANLARLLGTVHYFLRRFGPAPDYVRRLGRR